MNLGSFGVAAGALSQGMNEQRRLALAEQEAASSRNLRERQVAMQEEDQKFQRDRVQKQEAKRAELQKLFQETYADGKAPGADPMIDSRYLGGVMRLAAGDMEPDKILQLGEAVEKAKGTAAGRSLSAVLAGDLSQLDEFAKKVGKDPKGAKLQLDPLKGVHRIVWGDGSDTDLKRAALAAGAHDLYSRMRESESDARAQDKATRENKLTDARIATEGAQANAYRSTANLNNAKARGNVGTGGSGGGARVTRELQAAVKMVAPKSFDGKTDPSGTSAVLGIAASMIQAGKAKDVNSAAAAASKEYTRLSQQAERDAAEAVKRAKADPKAKASLESMYGKVDFDTLRAMALSKYMQSAGYSAAGSYDEEE